MPRKLFGIALIALPFTLFALALTPSANAVTVIGIALVSASLIVGGVELLDS